MQAQMNPFIISVDARSQANFYIEAIGGEIIMLKTYGEIPGTPEISKDKVMHLSLQLAGLNQLFMSDTFQETVIGSNIGLALSFEEEEDAHSAHLNLSKGGTVKFPLTLQPWGSYYGEVLDKFGITWQIVKHNY